MSIKSKINNEDNKSSEFERIRELFLENEKFGENRVNCLISFISAMTAILTGIEALEAFGGDHVADMIHSWIQYIFDNMTAASNTSSVNTTAASNTSDLVTLDDM
jgi:hypothetical protein